MYDEITGVNAEILRAQNPKTFPTQQGKLNDLVSTTRGNSSGVQTSSSDSINTPQVKSTDTTGNDTKGGNTLRPVATTDGEQAGRGTGEATQGEQTSTESQVEPVAPNDAKVTVLQGVTDEVAAEREYLDYYKYSWFWMVNVFNVLYADLKSIKDERVQDPLLKSKGV